MCSTGVPADFGFRIGQMRKCRKTNVSYEHLRVIEPGGIFAFSICRNKYARRRRREPSKTDRRIRRIRSKNQRLCGRERPSKAGNWRLHDIERGVPRIKFRVFGRKKPTKKTILV